VKFAAVAIDKSVGAILAHSLKAGDGQLKKGKILDPQDVVRLRDMGLEEVTVARLGPGDLDEDAAAASIAESLVGGSPGLRRTPASTGRSNIHADMTGLVAVRSPGVIRLNSLGGGITLATLDNLSRVHPGTMIGTLKIVTYGVPLRSVEKARAIAGDIFTFWPVAVASASLIITTYPTTRDTSVAKGIRVIDQRLAGLGLEMQDVRRVPHTVDGIATALKTIAGDMILILTASATSDRNDTGPLAVTRAGGRIEHFGIPVDPGNLLFHGHLEGRPVLGLPGCARSPARNGTDWFLERLACGVPITRRDIAAMGVGGLLKEIPSRPQPRERCRES